MFTLIIIDIQTEIPYIRVKRKQGSGILKSMLVANVFIVLDENISFDLIKLFVLGQRSILKFNKKRKDCYA
jgi:hypothetical protein